MNLILLLSVFILFLGIALFMFTYRQRSKYGALATRTLYMDTARSPGSVLHSHTIPLLGKPDYLINQSGHIIPVEIKTGKTPRTPYHNHVLQLLAYCYLVEENYGQVPPYGIIKYPEQEYKVGYDEKTKQLVKTIVDEIMKNKQSGEEFYCRHPYHNLISYQTGHAAQ